MFHDRRVKKKRGRGSSGKLGANSENSRLVIDLVSFRINIINRWWQWWSYMWCRKSGLLAASTHVLQYTLDLTVMVLLLSVKAAWNEALIWEQWLSAGIRFLMSQKEKSDPTGSLIWTFLLSCLRLSAEISMCVREGVRDAASAPMHLCVCFLLLLSSSCLYSTVPTSRDSVFHLFDIKSYYSLRCRVHLSDFFCLSVSLPGCLVLGFFPVRERQGLTCLMRWCITRAGRLHNGSRRIQLFVSVCFVWMC